MAAMLPSANHNQRLLKKAEELCRDGRISHADAKQLWDMAQETGPSEADMATLAHTMKAMNYTEKAATFLAALIRDPLARDARPKAAQSPPQRSNYVQKSGIKYDRELLEMAELFARNGQISQKEAKRLWDCTQDGKQISEIERRTLQHTMEIHNFTERAASFLKAMLHDGRPKPPYVQIAGVRYDLQLLELADGFAKDGRISLQEAQQLWEQAEDTRGVSLLEKRTLRFILESYTHTRPAAAFLHERLKVVPEEAAASKKSPGDPSGPPSGAEQPPPRQSRSSQGRGAAGGKKITVRWRWYKPRGYAYPAYPVVVPRSTHKFSLVLCHPMGWSGVFFLGSGALVEHLLARSQLIRDHCRILCPGAKKHGDWKLWFQYRGKDKGGTSKCHAQPINRADLGQTIGFVSHVIAREVAALNNNPARLAICGYSQGGCVSQAVGLTSAHKLGLIISQRGMLMKQTMDEYDSRNSSNSNSSSVNSKGIGGNSSSGVNTSASKAVGGGSSSSSSSTTTTSTAATATATSRIRQNFLLTAGGQDDVYLEGNQLESKKWLEARGHRVAYKVFRDLNHGDHHAGEMAEIRAALVAAFEMADSKRSAVAARATASSNSARNGTSSLARKLRAASRKLGTSRKAQREGSPPRPSRKSVARRASTSSSPAKTQKPVLQQSPARGLKRPLPEAEKLVNNSAKRKQ